jgi:hypothetical protein
MFFLFYSLSAQDEENTNNIVISKKKVEQLVSDWEKKSMSVASDKERQKIIDKEVYDTVLYNEALKIGLDKNDMDIRKHLITKMAFVTYDTSELPKPSDEVLKKFMIENPKKYRQEEKISFTQNFMGVDTTHFEKTYTLSKFEASTVFGDAFSKALFELNKDGKTHKIESAYGVHDVQVVAKSKVALKPFESVKEELEADYLNKQREAHNKVSYEALKSKYNIDVEDK